VQEEKRVYYLKVEGLTQITQVELSSEYYFHILMLFMLDELIDAELSDRYLDFFRIASFLISNIVVSAQQSLRVYLQKHYIAQFSKEVIQLGTIKFLLIFLSLLRDGLLVEQVEGISHLLEELVQFYPHFGFYRR
jgi:hypothetical protein